MVNLGFTPIASFFKARRFSVVTSHSIYTYMKESTLVPTEVSRINQAKKNENDKSK